jgi:hypothetical protein
MAREAGELKCDCCLPYYGETDIEGFEGFLKRFAELVRADERKNKPHSLDPGEMELSLRREHNGELFEYRHRFSAVQVMHGPIFMVTDAAKRMDDEIDAAIRERSANAGARRST